MSIDISAEPVSAGTNTEQAKASPQAETDLRTLLHQPVSLDKQPANN